MGDRGTKLYADSLPSEPFVPKGGSGKAFSSPLPNSLPTFKLSHASNFYEITFIDSL